MRRARVVLQATTMAALMAAATTWVAVGGPLMRVSYVEPNPTIIDISVTKVGFDAQSINVSGRLDCAANVEMLSIDFTASQQRGANTADGFSTLLEPVCGGDFNTSVTSSDATPFGPGRVVIDIAAVGCLESCADEIVHLDAVITPKAQLP